MKKSKSSNRMPVRHAALLLCLVLVLWGAPTTLKAQERPIVLPSTQVSVADAISRIESQAGLIIGVNHGNFDVSRNVRLGSATLGVNELLDDIVAGTGHTYIRKDRHVIIVTSNAPVVTAAKKVALLEGTPQNPVTQVQIEEAIKEMEPEILPEDMPEPEITTFRRVAYDGGLQTLSFSAEDPLKFSRIEEKQPSLALKTNLGYGLATLTPNLGIEFGMGRKTTLEVTGGWNPWKLEGSNEDNKKHVHAFIQPEFRWWTCERFNGHFFGVHGVGAVYNISQHKLPFFGFEKDYRYQGHAVGAGVSYGYSAMISPVVSLEFTAGIGGWWLNYDRYDCTKCVENFESFDKFRFGPTKIGISLVFILK